MSAFPPATTTVCLATGFFSLFVLRVQPTPVRLPVCTSIWPYTTSPSELVLRLDESLGVRAELSPPNAYRNVPFTPKPRWLRAKGRDVSGAHAPSVPSEVIGARYTVATGVLPAADPPAMYTEPLKTTAPREWTGAGSALVVLQPVTAPLAPKIPR